MCRGIAAIGGGFNRIKDSNKRPFSLQDPSIGYPVKGDTVSVTVLFIIALLAPAVITLVISFLFVPGPTASKTTPKALVWRRKIWEWNTAWMGLGLSLASAFMITEGLKDLAGKPRPYALNKCNPNLDAIDQYRIGGLGQSFDTTGATPILVTSGICQETDPATLREIFASWPSGHSSFSFAGLLYLSLFLCAKFSVGIPYVTPNTKQAKENTYDYDNYLRHPTEGLSSPASRSSTTENYSVSPPLRNSSAASPIYLLILAVYLPVGTAIFVCVSRWFDFHHHGIDILSGALLGAFTAWFSFRYYHMPIRRGSGWAWGARSRDRAFWIGVGRDGYVGDEGWCTAQDAKTMKRDIELGSSQVAHKDVTGPGIEDRGESNDSERHLAHETPQQGYTINSSAR